MNYREALDYIYSFTNFEVTPAGRYSSKTFDLSRIERLLAALGEPQSRFRSIHIAGTKGKGSTAAMLESVLRAEGYQTGLFTSPHLHTFRERIRLHGRLISEEEVAAGVEKIREIAGQIQGLTSFEIMTALGFDYFASLGVELAVIEVGLGGRLDATNVVTPLVSVITSVSFDHTAILGETLTAISREKAGIIKATIPAVCSPQDPEALGVIEKVARERGAPLVVVSRELEFKVKGSKFQVVPVGQAMDSQTCRLQGAAPNDGRVKPLTLKIPLAGQHQLSNAATALATALVLRQQGLSISDKAIQEGMATVEWPGRFEVLSSTPLVIVDGAHNSDSMGRLDETLKSLYPDRRLVLVFGAYGDKDISGMFAEIVPHAALLVLTRSSSPRAADVSHLAKLAAHFRVETHIASDIPLALNKAVSLAGAGDVICVTGSLLVVAEARAAWLNAHGKPVESD